MKGIWKKASQLVPEVDQVKTTDGFKRVTKIEPVGSDTIKIHLEGMPDPFTVHKDTQVRVG